MYLWVEIADVVTWWGLSLPQTLLILGLILVLVDVFFQEDQATHIAYVLGATAVALWVPVHPLYRVLIGLLAWVALVYLHYTVWREFVTQFVNRIVAPTRYRSGPRGLLGQKGKIKLVQGKKMLCLQGDLWSYESPDDLPDGAEVKVVGERGGILLVESSHERS